MSGEEPSLSVGLAHLGRLIPMHLMLSAEGRILSVGPTLDKALGQPGLVGTPLFDAFEVRRPGGIADFDALRMRGPGQFTLALRDGAQGFRCFATPTTDGGLIVKTSFGGDLVAAVAAHGLTGADFTATDHAIEMLYLYEAKSLVMGELRSLAQRLHGAKRQAEAQAMTDTLTGLANRRALDQALGRAARPDGAFGLMHLDLDWFKAVNDTLGHAAGDQVLREVARILREETRRSDTVARVGGDEFVIIFDGMTDRTALAGIAERLVARLSEPIDFEGKPCRISASIGIALSTDYDSPEAERILSDADTALYASKRAGRGRAMFHVAGRDA